MPVHCQILPDHALILARLSGRFEPSEVLEAFLDMASKSDFRPGLDRLLITDTSLDVSHVDTETLESMRRAIRDDFEKAGGQVAALPATVAFRSACVCPVDFQRPLAKLFGALWAVDPSTDVTFKVFESTEEALSWLDRASLLLPA